MVPYHLQVPRDDFCGSYLEIHWRWRTLWCCWENPVSPDSSCHWRLGWENPVSPCSSCHWRLGWENRVSPHSPCHWRLGWENPVSPHSPCHRRLGWPRNHHSRERWFADCPQRVRPLEYCEKWVPRPIHSHFQERGEHPLKRDPSCHRNIHLNHPLQQCSRLDQR